MFADTAVNDFRLLPCSPAVNFGSNPAADAAGLVMDLDGHPRIFDGTVDLGAYEAQDTCGMVPVTEIPGDLAPLTGLFPNPAEPDAVVTVSLPEVKAASAVHWRLEDMTGRLVASGVAGGPVFTIRAPAMVGVYFFVAERGSALRVARLAVR